MVWHSIVDIYWRDHQLGRTGVVTDDFPAESGTWLTLKDWKIQASDGEESRVQEEQCGRGAGMSMPLCGGETRWTGMENSFEW